MKTLRKILHEIKRTPEQASKVLSRLSRIQSKGKGRIYLKEPDDLTDREIEIAGHAYDYAHHFFRKNKNIQNVPIKSLVFHQGHVDFSSNYFLHKQKAPLPPINVVKIDGRHHVIDGHHRVLEQIAMGQVKIPAKVIEAKNVIAHAKSHDIDLQETNVSAGIGVLQEPESDNWWSKTGTKGVSLTGMGKTGKTVSKIIQEAQDNDPEEVAQARRAYLEHMKSIHALGKQMGDVRNRDLQAQIDAHQKAANAAQQIFRSWDMRQARAKTMVAMMTGRTVVEKAPSTSSGAGQIAGLGPTSFGKPVNFAEPGVPAKSEYKKKNKEESPVMGEILRRPMLDGLSENTGKFAGHTTHKVPHETFNKIRQEKAKGKHWRKYLDECEHISHIREFAKKNPTKPIIIEDEKTGYMCFARYGK